MPERPTRVIALAPLPPETCAYALARYSRSPDSIHDSLAWVRSHDSQKFLESFYFQYGHASIADLGHLAMCFENISELAAIEIEDEQLWDGQARSSRYQDFSRCGFYAPPGLGEEYESAAAGLLEAYSAVHARVFEYLTEKHPKPEGMAAEKYRRNISARSYDVARYLLFLAVPTNVGQITSIRTLEKQIGRLGISDYAELRAIAAEMTAACGAPPGCASSSETAQPPAPTLARFAAPDEYRRRVRADLRLWAQQNLPPAADSQPRTVDLLRPGQAAADVAATLLYPVTDRPFRELYRTMVSWSEQRRLEVIDIAVRSRRARDELLREFSNAPYAFDMVMDIGAYRDLHRHRRCQQFRQDFTARLGYEVPEAAREAGAGGLCDSALQRAYETFSRLSPPESHYLLPFATRTRVLFRMDFAEADYICRLRSGVKGHFSYRRIAWEMKKAMEELEPELGRIIQATPPWVEDILLR